MWIIKSILMLRDVLKNVFPLDVLVVTVLLLQEKVKRMTKINGLMQQLQYIHWMELKQILSEVLCQIISTVHMMTDEVMQKLNLEFIQLK